MTTVTELKLDPDIKAKWLTALRSGDYKQGQNYLHYTETYDGQKADYYCCLGVLCDIAVKEGVVEVEEQSDDGVVRWAYDWSGTMPTSVVAKWAYATDSLNVDRNAWLVPVSDRLCSLSELNDDRGFSFAQIADVIERNL